MRLLSLGITSLGHPHGHRGYRICLALHLDRDLRNLQCDQQLQWPNRLSIFQEKETERERGRTNKKSQRGTAQVDQSSAGDKQPGSCSGLIPSSKPHSQVGRPQPGSCWHGEGQVMAGRLSSAVERLMLKMHRSD